VEFGGERGRGWDGVAMWVGSENRRVVVAHCSSLLCAFELGRTNACYLKGEVKVAFVEPLECLNESNPDCSHISI